MFGSLVLSDTLDTVLFSSLEIGDRFMLVDKFTGECVPFIRINDCTDEFGGENTAVGLNDGYARPFADTDRVHLWE